MCVRSYVHCDGRFAERQENSFDTLPDGEGTTVSQLHSACPTTASATRRQPRTRSAAQDKRTNLRALGRLPLPSRGAFRAFIATLFIALSLLVAGISAQQASTQGAGNFQSPQSGLSGPVPVPWTCDGAGWSPFWDDPVTLVISIYVNNALVTSAPFYGVGQISGSHSGTVMLGRAQVTILCAVSLAASWAGFAEAFDSAVLPLRQPWGLTNDINVETFVYNGPGDYLRSRGYVVYDQYGWVWGFVDSVTEWYEQHGLNECNIISVDTGQGATNEVGRFSDRYGNHDGNSAIPACALPQYQACRSEFNQFINVAGVTFDHPVTWRCDDVHVSR